MNESMPFLKWVGGKTQSMDDLLEHFPIQIKGRYIEPFLGGGSVLFGVLKRYSNGKKCIVNDINGNLISLWKFVQSHPTEFHTQAKSIWDEYASTENKEAHYYTLREEYNKTKHNFDSIRVAAIFLFLNKMGFRGMYRENRDGKFNIPFGNYKRTPTLLSRDEWCDISEQIRGVQFMNMDVTELITMLDVNSNDVIYCDPPYAPETATSFVSYTKQHINGEFHSRLFTALHTLRRKGVSIGMSNAAVPLVLDAFPQTDWNITTIECRRAIHSKNPGSKTNEVIIWS